MTPRLYYTDHHEFALPPGHRFPLRKYRLVRELLARGGNWRFEPAPFAPVEAIERAHDSEYVRRFLDGTLDPARMRRIGFPWSEGLVRRTLASVGGTLAAAADALARGFGGTLAGGTHHACRAEGAGYCVFNDIAVAILSLGRRAAVLDLDVHQGDGTAEIFSGEGAVLTVSLHARNNFPFRKRPGNIDIELDDGAGDEEYLRALDAVLPRVIEFAPEVVFYQSGVDALASDRLGRLSMTPGGLEQRDRQVLEGCRGAGVPVVVTLGGGYSEPIEITAEAHATTFRVAASVFDTAL